MPRLVSFVFASKPEEDRFFELLQNIDKLATDFETATRKELLDKSNFQISNVADFTGQVRAALSEIEALVRD